MALRRFQYRDDATIDDYVGALELGLPEDEVRRDEANRSGKASLEIAGIGIGGDRGSTHGVERNLRQTAASKVEALFRMLAVQEPKELWDLDGLDEDTWGCLDRGSLINLEVTVRIPSIVRALGIAQDLGPLVEVMKAFRPDLHMVSSRRPTWMSAANSISASPNESGTRRTSFGKPPPDRPLGEARP